MVAVVLVVLYHAGVAPISGGYVGVDAFFVISGFVITGLLLRERASRGRTSILHFYGRRCRRIIPAATLVIITTVAISYAFSGAGIGARTAVDGRWAAVFLANFHFWAVGTNYLSSQQPPSPLQNYWSLSVEEQFYIVYPTLFVLLAGLKTLSLRARLALGLGAIVVASFAFSIIDTASNSTGAYFSPFTRAWELALGALVAVGTPWLLQIPARLAALITWIGLTAILVAGVTFDAHTAYPGSLTSIPVVGAALVIAGGMAAPRLGAEALLGSAPFRGMGRISYSLYLWHWPILIVAAEHAGKTSLSVRENLEWVVVALIASIASYFLVENPVRHAEVLSRRRLASIGLGITLVVATIGVVAIQSNLNAPPGSPSVAGSRPPGGGSPIGSGQGDSDPIRDVERVVAASTRIKSMPRNLVPPLSQIESESNLGWPPAKTGCFAIYGQSIVPRCAFGDLSGTETMVLYGDSHAAMWFRALDEIAVRSHWKLIVLAKVGCPAGLLATHAPGESGEWVACDQWHRFAVQRIDQIDPNLLLISQEIQPKPDGGAYTATQWRRGLTKLFSRIHAPRAKEVIIGNIPHATGPDCLLQHLSDVQACSTVPSRSDLVGFNQVERQAARTAGAGYINVVPWFCSTVCSSVIGNYDVYADHKHVAVGYTRFLEGAMTEALHLEG